MKKKCKLGEKYGLLLRTKTCKQSFKSANL